MNSSAAPPLGEEAVELVLLVMQLASVNFYSYCCYTKYICHSEGASGVLLSSLMS